MGYRGDVARHFWSKAKFEKYFLTRVALFRITDFKGIIFLRSRKKSVPFDTSRQDYVQFLAKFGSKDYDK